MLSYFSLESLLCGPLEELLLGLLLGRAPVGHDGLAAEVAVEPGCGPHRG